MTTLHSSPLILARDGQPAFEIVLSKGASAPEEFAAEELHRTFFELIGPGAYRRNPGRSGVPKIFINDRDAVRRAGIDQTGLDLDREAFHLETRDNNLYLMGGGSRGTLYAVYELLERLGCRWFTPEINHIPRQPQLSLPPLCITGKPAFENRDTYNRECQDSVWWVRNRMNGWYTSLPEYMGGNIGYCGFVHTFYSLLPPEEFFDAHPEYYSLVAGQRRREVAQLCLTNSEVLRIVTQRVLELMRTHPRETIFSVSQNDCQGFCECEVCQAVAREEGSQSGPLLRFVNAVAEETSRHYPDKLIDTLAYQYSLDAPRVVVPHPNVRVRLCSITCCQGHPYGTCEHPESMRFLTALQAWGARTSQLYVWHYATNFTHYPTPMPDFDELHGNLNLYHRSGVRGLFIQGMGEPGGGAESMALRGYVVSKLLWNPDQPVWPLVDEFLPAYYGAAAPGVRRYLEIFHQAVRADRSLHPSLYDLPSGRLLDDDLRLPADQALAEAERSVRGEQRQRVQLLRAGLGYARLFRACGTFQRHGDTYAGNAAESDVQDLNDLVRLWKKAGIQRIREAEDFDFSVQKLRNRLQQHPVEWLDDGGQRLAIVPDLGSRIIEWHTHGRQWLAQAIADNTWSVHPNSGGYSEFAVVGMYSTCGWGEIYRAAWQTGRLNLSARIGRGLHLSKRLLLQDGRLLIHSRLRNIGNEILNCGWGAALHLSLPSKAQVGFRSLDGETNILWDSWPPENKLTFTGEKAPQREWQVITREGIISCAFAGAIESFNLIKEDQPLSLNLDWRTAMLSLLPGESRVFTQTLWIDPSSEKDDYQFANANSG